MKKLTLLAAILLFPSGSASGNPGEQLGPTDLEEQYRLVAERIGSPTSLASRLAAARLDIPFTEFPTVEGAHQAIVEHRCDGTTLSVQPSVSGQRAVVPSLLRSLASLRSQLVPDPKWAI